MFRNLSIRRKLGALLLLANLVALVLALVGIAIYERAHLRHSAVDELTVLADTLGTNAAASLAFDDIRTAGTVLGALRAEPRIASACLYDARSRVFAQYRRADVRSQCSTLALNGPAYVFTADSLVLCRRVSLNGVNTGSIVIVSDLAASHQQWIGFVEVAVLVLLLSLAMTQVSANRIIRVVSDPIVSLSTVADRVSAQKDFTARTVGRGKDEVKRLVTAFNGMSEAIQQRDRALLEAKNELESRVEQRTVELRREIQERKEAEAKINAAKEAAEVASRAKSEFLANMSHEIRTPLNGVIGMAELAMDANPQGELREYLHTIKLSADALLTVINDILDFSKVEAGKIDLNVQEFNLRDCLEEVLKPLALRADEKGIELMCDFVEGVPEVVRGDPARLRQILLNLVGNAVKFTHKGEVAVRVESDGSATNAHMLRFTVADTGIGIGPDSRQAIFEPFVQADTSTTRQYGGTGLGLTISARLVSIMGGRIWLQSEVGHGTQFYFTVPLPCVSREVTEPVQLPTEDLRGLRVLVVDDNTTNRRIVTGILHQYGVLTDDVDSGQHALATLIAAHEAGNDYRLVLTDMHMPGMDGFQLAERIRQLPYLAALPIMMLSSATHREDMEHCRTLGITSYLVKPIRKRELLSAILNALATDKHWECASSATHTSNVEPSHIRMLLAEDNVINQKVAVGILEKLGYSVVVANNGAEALVLLEQEHFDLVLMDIQMPEVDGFTATSQVRDNEVATNRHVPIIAMTAHAMKGDRERCLRAGMDGYVSKPINKDELRHEISSVLGIPCMDTCTAGSLESDPSSSSRPLMWNANETLEKLGGDEKLLREVVQIFLTETPRNLDRLRTAVSDGDSDVVEKKAHSLKGELGYLGVAATMQKARELEEMGRKRMLRHAAPVLASLERDVSSILAAMRDSTGLQVTAGAPK